MPDSDRFDIGVQRDGGLTHVLDKGLGPRAWEDVLETAGEYIDIVKLGWGTAWVTGNLEEKLDVLRDKPVVIGGTFFEVVFARDKLDEYKRWLTKHGLTHVEISDGTVEIPRERKLELIADFARDFTVLSEVGAKEEPPESSGRRARCAPASSTRSPIRSTSTTLSGRRRRRRPKPGSSSTS